MIVDVAEALTIAYALPPFPQAALQMPEGTVCALSGVLLSVGYPLPAILSSSSADLASTFPYASRFVSEAVARAYKAPAILQGSLLALEGQDGSWQGLSPVVSRASVAPDRPVWRDMLMQMPPGQRTVAVVSAEKGLARQRLWPKTRISTLGPAWQVYFHGPQVQALLTLNIDTLRVCLSAVEAAYRAGFSKEMIARSLLSHRAQHAIEALGILQTQTLEAALAPFRPFPLFSLALFVAQKDEETV